MSECEFNQEGFCILQCEYPKAKKCKYAKGDIQECTATDDDLVEICSDCDKPIEECDCGTNWVMVEDSEGNFGLVTPKRFHELKLKEEEKAKPT
jgi:hypothetical protein